MFQSLAPYPAPLGEDAYYGIAGRAFNALVGGWQLAGTGSMGSNYFALQTGMFGPRSKLQVYGKKYPIQDCRSGACIAGYLWYNGYIPANQINILQRV